MDCTWLVGPDDVMKYWNKGTNENELKREKLMLRVFPAWPLVVRGDVPIGQKPYKDRKLGTLELCDHPLNVPGLILSERNKGLTKGKCCS